jgi:predicted transcriptional regulator
MTISEMAQLLGIKENTVRNRLYVSKRLPFVTRVSLYTKADFEAIKAMSKVGRPKKDGEGDN